MNSIAVDPPFTDTKTKKTTIKRDMKTRQEATGTYVDVVFTCNEEEVASMRTCITSFVTNMSLVCETLKEFGN